MIFYTNPGSTNPPVGPIATDLFIQLIRDGFVQKDDMYWEEGVDEWLPVSQFVSSNNLLSPTGSVLTQPIATSKPLTQPEDLGKRKEEKKSQAIESWVKESEELKAIKKITEKIPTAKPAPAAPKRLSASIQALEENEKNETAPVVTPAPTAKVEEISPNPSELNLTPSQRIKDSTKDQKPEEKILPPAPNPDPKPTPIPAPSIASSPQFNQKTQPVETSEPKPANRNTHLVPIQEVTTKIIVEPVEESDNAPKEKTASVLTSAHKIPETAKPDPVPETKSQRILIANMRKTEKKAPQDTEQKISTPSSQQQPIAASIYSATSQANVNQAAQEAPQNEIPNVFAPSDLSQVLLGKRNSKDQVDFSFDNLDDETVIKSEGLGRFGYYFFTFILIPLIFIGSFLFGIIPGLMRMKIFPQGEITAKTGVDFLEFPWNSFAFIDPEIVAGIGGLGLLLAGFIAFIVTLQRFKNAAVTRLWFFALFIPIVRIYPSWILMCAPPGFGVTRRLGKMGWILTTLFGALFIATFVYGFLHSQNVLNQINESSAQFQKIYEDYSTKDKKKEKDAKDSKENPQQPAPADPNQPAQPTTPQPSIPTQPTPPSNPIPSPGNPGVPAIPAPPTL